jgi:glutamyl-tRNA reductase
VVADAMRARPQRPLVLLDLALPRDVEPSCAEIDGVVVRDLDALRSALDPTPEQRSEIERVRGIVEEEVPKFIAWQRAHGFAPLMAALQQRAEEIRVRAMQRAASKLGDLNEEQREALEALTRSIVAKLLHRPLTMVKAAAGTAEGERLAQALRQMFGVED